MTKFRKKPVVIEAFKLGHHPMPGWFMDRVSANTVVLHKGGKVLADGDNGRDSVNATIVTLEGAMAASDGDWIIKGVQGELYPCKPDIFAATYDLVA